MANQLAGSDHSQHLCTRMNVPYPTARAPIHYRKVNRCEPQRVPGAGRHWAYTIFDGRQVFDAAQSSLKTISLAVVGDNELFVRTVLCRTVANTLSMGLVVRR